METSLIHCLEHCYSCCALVTIRGNELVIFHGIALYSDDKYILYTIILFMYMYMYLVPQQQKPPPVSKPLSPGAICLSPLSTLPLSFSVPPPHSSSPPPPQSAVPLYSPLPVAMTTCKSAGFCLSTISAYLLSKAEL